MTKQYTYTKNKDDFMGSENRIEKVYGMTDVIHEVKRMADAMEEVLRMVKKDQEDTKKRWEKEDNE